MIVNINVFCKLCYRIRKKNISKIELLDRNSNFFKIEKNDFKFLNKLKYYCY